jgi:triphosphoribosyl-dephospho-CoA synthase
MPVDCCVRLACLLEATARKPGNVHPSAAFADLQYADFLRAAAAVAPILAEAEIASVGRTVRRAVEASQSVAAGNVNLGIVLLLAPLAAVPPSVPLAQGIPAVLDGLTVEDAREVYAAIRLANPGGLGRASEQDVADEPTETLRAVMQRAAAWDAVAAQYASGFGDVLDFGPQRLEVHWRSGTNWETAVVGLHLELMARRPDTLIARKCGPETAAESSRLASQILRAGWPDSAAGRLMLAEFDLWLRADGHRRNPGTTADLVAASLFTGLREGRLEPPCCTLG